MKIDDEMAYVSEEIEFRRLEESRLEKVRYTALLTDRLWRQGKQPVEGFDSSVQSQLEYLLHNWSGNRLYFQWWEEHPSRVGIQLDGVGIVLTSDGTWYLEDTSGG